MDQNETIIPLKKGDRVKLSEEWKRHCRVYTGWRLDRVGTIISDRVYRECQRVSWDGLTGTQYYHISFLKKVEEKTMETISAKSSGLLGDVIYALPALKTAYEKYGKKIVLYLWLNKAWEAYGNYHDATKKGEGLLTEQSYEMLKPLLEAMPFIERVEKWTGQQIVIDLDKPKVMGKSIGLPYANMSRQYFYAYPDLACDLSKPVFSIKDMRGKLPYFHYETENMVVVNRTERWLNPHINYMFLQQYKTYFIGTLTEYNLFLLQVPNAKYIELENFAQLTEVLHESRLFIGNQSFCYALAEQMKVPRILEVCPEAPNVMPIGPNGYDFHSQEAFEYYVQESMK